MTPKTLACRLAGAVVLACVAHQACAQTPVLKVDLDQAGRPATQVNEPGFEPWPIPGDATASKTFDEGVTITFSRQGSNGTGVKSDWYKGGFDAPHDARLVSDGIIVEDGNAGAELLMTITGLPAGEHTLLLYHNNTPSPETNSFAPVDISVNGTLVVDDLIPSIRALATSEAVTSYLTLDSTGGDVEVLIRAETGTDANNKNVMINGFELNTPNAALQAVDPVPSDGDQHVEADDGEFTLNWTAGPEAVAHELYFGTDEDAVSNGTDGTYVGSQSGTGIHVSNLYSRDLYYWRVDQVDASGNITKGNIWSFRPRQLAFPGAEGYGRFAIGGRGGKVVKVTSLNDDGAGSLREAITDDTGPRTIVFDVGGIITLESRLVINQPYITVAGQTAPGKGIAIRSAPFGMSGASDVVMQHVRVRLGAGTTYDGIGMQGSDHSIVDRSSISWTIDEAFSSRSGKNITLQRTLISEALNAAGHSNYPAGTEHGFAASISGDIGSFHHNLLAHNYGRNWSLAGGLDGNGNYAGRLDIFNNVVYNWGKRTTDGGAHEVNFVNNYYKSGPATEQFYALNVQYDNFPGTQQYYCAGNVVIPQYPDADAQRNACRVSAGAPQGYSTWVDAPFFDSHATVHTAAQAYKQVLSDAGASQPVLDDHDTRMITETLAGTYTTVGSVTGKKGLPDHQDDSGGYEDYPEVSRDADWDSDGDGLPDWWEQLFGLNPHSAGGDFSDANQDVNFDGYTELDYYLQWKSETHYRVAYGEQVSIDLPATFRGYESAPSYTVDNVANGSVAIDGETALFTPAECGLAFFDLTVTDSEGDSMTRSVGVFVNSEVPGECVGEPRASGSQSSVSFSSVPSSGGGSSSSSTPATEPPSGNSGGSGGGAMNPGWLGLLLALLFLGRRRVR